MAHTDRKKAVLTVGMETIRVASFYTPEEIATLGFHDAFTKYPRYNPIISKVESLINAASHPDVNVTLAVTSENRIVGFSILEYPAPGERWLRTGDRVTMEISVVEVARPYRTGGLAKTILELALEHPKKEDRIVYMVGYSWTWDLEEFKKPVMEYRNMMVELFALFGFKIFQTNEHNIMMRPENLFMARIGANISQDTQNKFKMILFNLDD